MFTIPGSWEWIIICLIVFIIFGKRLPNIMKSMGKAFGGYKKEFKDVEEEINVVKDIKNGIDNIRNFRSG